MSGARLPGVEVQDFGKSMMRKLLEQERQEERGLTVEVFDKDGDVTAARTLARHSRVLSAVLRVARRAIDAMTTRPEWVDLTGEDAQRIKGCTVQAIVDHGFRVEAGEATDVLPMPDGLDYSRLLALADLAHGVLSQPAVYVVMERAPGPDGDFVEVEDQAGRGIGGALKWAKRPDGKWNLGPFFLRPDSIGSGPPSPEEGGPSSPEEGGPR